MKRLFAKENIRPRLALLCLVSAGIFSQTACKSRPDSKTKDSALGDLEQVAQSDFLNLCNFFYDPLNPVECRSSKLIAALCGEKKNSMDDSIKSLLLAKKVDDIGLSPAAEAKVHEAFKKDAIASIVGEVTDDVHQLFNKAADLCLNHTEHKEQHDFDLKMQTPEFQAELASYRQEIITAMVLQGMTGASWQSAPKALEIMATKFGVKDFKSVQGFFAKYKLKFSPLSWKAYVGLIGCSAGTALISGVLDSIPFFMNQGQGTQPQSKPDNDVCKQVTHDWVTSPRTKVMSCLDALGDICNSALMTVDLQNFGVTSTSDMVRFGISMTNVGLSLLCASAGQYARIGCSAVNYYANQIMQVRNTGTTKAAQCTGADKLGACVGTMIGSGGWYNDSPVATPESVKDNSGNNWIVRDCCTCDKLHFEKAGTSIVYWLLNTETEHYVSVIQKGDFKTGNCGVRENEKIQDGTNSKLFVQYANCRRVTVIGGSCSLASSENGKLTPQNLPLWDRKKKQPVGDVISAGVDYTNIFYSGDEFR